MVKPKVWTTCSNGVQPVFGITMRQKIHSLPPHPNPRAEIKLLGAPKSTSHKVTRGTQEHVANRTQSTSPCELQFTFSLNS